MSAARESRLTETHPSPDASKKSPTGHFSPVVRGSMALLLCGETLSSGERNLIALLEFFGIPCKRLTVGQLTRVSGFPEEIESPFCLLSSAALLADAIGNAERGAVLPEWLARASTVYVHDFQQTERCARLLKLLTGATTVAIQPLTGSPSLSISGDFPELCGPLSGLQSAIKPTEGDGAFEISADAPGLLKIIRAGDADVFVSVSYGRVRFFLNACAETIDILAPATTYFDVRVHFCSAVPITMYLKWAFATCWTGAEQLGCLIVDDPPLKRRYGFLNLRNALELMDDHGFTMALAFIPWNWRRTNDGAVELFRRRPDRLSLCVHGCDHTAGEFAARSVPLLQRRIRLALGRMGSLSRKSGLPHDLVMVFPQGSFSPESGRVLKLNGFLAGANTEVSPAGGAPNATRIVDLWSVAIMQYGTFPIFTRRYLTHGIENFAFDALLGKPCLLVGHHDVFRDGGRELVEFIRKLNSLSGNLRWSSLGQVLRNAVRVRYLSGKRFVEMYSSQVVLRSHTTEPETVIVRKEESDPDRIKRIMVNTTTVEYAHRGTHLEFEFHLAPAEKAEVRVIYTDGMEPEPESDDLRYRLKTRLRRHLSEFRDNYVSRSSLLQAGAHRVRILLKRTH